MGHVDPNMGSLKIAEIRGYSFLPNPWIARTSCSLSHPKITKSYAVKKGQKIVIEGIKYQTVQKVFNSAKSARKSQKEWKSANNCKNCKKKITSI